MPLEIIAGIVFLLLIAAGLILLRTNRRHMFFSYKSDDATLVRQVADQLQSMGFKIWFAEYEILLNNRNRFQALVEKGIRRSKYFVAFTNNKYAHSEHTRDGELRYALSMLKPESIIQIKLPDEAITSDKFPALKLADGNIFSCAPDARAIPGIIKFLLSRLGSSILPSSNNPVVDQVPPKDTIGSARPAWHIVERYGVRISFPTTGWREIEEAPGFIGVHPYEIDYDGPTFVPEKAAVEMKMQLGFWLSYKINRNHRVFTGEVQDRAVYDDLLAFSDHYAKKYATLKCRGVHLFHCLGYSQLMLTYWNPVQSSWTKKFVLLVPHPAITNFTLEIHFHISCRCRFQELCGLSSGLEAMASTILVEHGTYSSGQIRYGKTMPARNPSFFISGGNAGIFFDANTRKACIGNKLNFIIPNNWSVRKHDTLLPLDYIAILSPSGQDLPCISLQEIHAFPIRSDGIECPPIPNIPDFSGRETTVSGREAIILSYGNRNPLCKEFIVLFRKSYFVFRLDGAEISKGVDALESIIRTISWSP